MPDMTMHHEPFGSEHYGPPDMRTLTTEEIADARRRVVGLLRAVKVDEGYRAGAAAALAAISGAVDVLIELGQDGAALSTLQMQASFLAQRIEASAASEPMRTRH